MIVLRKKGPWSIQIYYPTVVIAKASKRAYIKFDTRIAVGVDLFAIEFFGFGFGILK